MSAADDDLVLALPSKGALHAPTIALLERCFLPVTGDGGGRSYNTRVRGLPGVAVLYARADEIPQLVRSGRAQVGITGLDLFLEYQDQESSRRVQLLVDDLGYGSANLEVGVPRAWIDVTGLADLAEVAHDIRHQHARPLLVATKFPNLSRHHFISRGFSDFRLVQSLGATEAAPRSGTADIVVDLVSSGATFNANGLTTIDGGLVLRSQAALIACGNLSVWSDPVVDRFRHVADLIDAALRAQRLRSLRATFPHQAGSRLPDDLTELLAGMTFRRLESDQCELVASFDRRHVHEVLALVRSAGATQAEVVACEIMASYRAPWIESFAASVRGP